MRFPSYRGFSGDHPLMVLWRKKHHIPLGMEEVVTSNFKQFRWVLLALFVICIIVMIAMNRYDTIMASLAFGLLLALAGCWALTWHIQCDLRYLVDADSFDDDLKNLIEEVHQHRRPGFDPDNPNEGIKSLAGWDWYSTEIPELLISLANEVLVQEEMDFRTKTISQVRMNIRRDFTMVYDWAETLGLVEPDRYDRCFDAARARRPPVPGVPGYTDHGRRVE